MTKKYRLFKGLRISFIIKLSNYRFGAGAYRMSAQMLLEEILFTEREMRERYGIGTDE